MCLFFPHISIRYTRTMSFSLSFFSVVSVSPCLSASPFLLFVQFLIEELLPYLGDAECSTHRQGAIETVACIHPRPPLDILYMCLLIVPTLLTVCNSSAYCYDGGTACKL